MDFAISSAVVTITFVAGQFSLGFTNASSQKKVMAINTMIMTLIIASSIVSALFFQWGTAQSFGSVILNYTLFSALFLLDQKPISRFSVVLFGWYSVVTALTLSGNLIALFDNDEVLFRLYEELITHHPAP